MKPEDLRIGNLAEWAEKPDEPINTIVAITGIYRDNQFGELLVDYQDIEAGGENTIELEYFKPIPLTEEWLERFGLKYNTKYMLFRKAGERGKMFSLFQGLLRDDYTHKNSGAHTKYVHQLQNLYYALCGEELTFETILKDKELDSDNHSNKKASSS